MQRIPRKRKLTEKALNNPELEHFRIKFEVKTEPEDDPPALSPVVCCYLCKLSSGVKLLALREDSTKRTEPSTIDKIKECIGWEILPEMDETSRICRPCIRQLDKHYEFRKQALHCNAYAQDQMAADEAEVVDVPTEIRVCRFCLKIGGKLIDLHPEGSTSDVLQLKKIRDCLEVEINSWDAVTKICRACIQRIQEFLDFREKYLPISVFVKQETDPPDTPHVPNALDDGFSYDGNGPDLEMSVSDSDCSIGESERIDPLTGGKKQVRPISAEVLQLIGTELEGRNFTSRKEDGSKIIVTFEGFQYRFFSTLESGGSVWVCIEKRLRSCGAKLEIDSSGIIASVIGKINNHSHSSRPAKLMECPAGKGFADCKGNPEPFWFFYGEQSNSSSKLTRSIIFQNYRYFLHQIRNNGANSVWYCLTRGAGKCKCSLFITRMFERIDVKGSHNHRPVSQKKINAVLAKIGIDSDSTEAISSFQRDVLDDEIEDCRPIKEQQKCAIQSLTKEKQPEVFRILSVDDPERKFECLHAGPKMKIKQDGYEYRYFGRQEDGTTLWKCIMDSLQHCGLVVRVDISGKQFDIFKGSKHSHKPEPAPLFSYPLGKRMIGEEPLWLILRHSMYYEGRCVIYRDNVFVILDINRKGVVRWNCLRKHSCRALLIVKGNFEEITFRNAHSHDNTAQEILTKLIEGRSPEIEFDEDVTFRQRLLSYQSTVGRIWNEASHQNETFYILKTMKTGETVTCGLVFHNFRYVLASLDQNCTSRWTCTKQNIRNVRCRASVIIEGLYESICIKSKHNHDAMHDSEMELMIKRSVADNPMDGEGQGKGGLAELLEIDSGSKNILSQLARHDPDRNFEVSRARSKIIIRYEEEDFRLRSRKPDGSSLWSCTWLKMRHCPVVLSLSADGKNVASVDPTKKHNHSEDQVALYHLNFGKGQIYDENKRVYSSYWLFGHPWEYRESRAIIYQGHKYYLNIIGNNRMSSWKCRIRNCKAYVRIEGNCKTLFHKHQHSHERLADDEILSITNSTEVDRDLLESNESLEVAVDPKDHEGPLRPATLLHILSTNDPDRNFHVTIYKDQMKIHQDRYEYYYRTSTETHSLWKCIYFTIRRCRATIHVSNDCKVATLPDVPKHNHKDELWDMFYYPLGEHSIMDAYTESVQPFWFLMQPGFFRSHPMIIYEDNKFTLASITENGDSSRWRCVTHLCRATLTVTGLFELVVGGHPHNHEPQQERKRAEWIRQFGTPGGSSVDTEDSYNVIPFVKVEMEYCDVMAYEDDAYVGM